MSHRLVVFRHLSARCVVLGLLALTAACGDDVNTGSNQPSETTTTVPGATLPGATTTLPLDVPTTYIADCAQMPTPAAISAIVGIPLADGQVIAAGTCEFRGVNEQNRVITLGLLIDPGDQASFNDVQLSLGPSTPLADGTLINAFVDLTSLLYISANGAIYTVRTVITDATPPEQVPLSVAVLHMWLGI